MISRKLFPKCHSAAWGLFLIIQCSDDLLRANFCNYAHQGKNTLQGTKAECKSHLIFNSKKHWSRTAEMLKAMAEVLARAGVANWNSKSCSWP